MHKIIRGCVTYKLFLLVNTCKFFKYTYTHIKTLLQKAKERNDESSRSQIHILKKPIVKNISQEGVGKLLYICFVNANVCVGVCLCVFSGYPVIILNKKINKIVNSKRD